MKRRERYIMAVIVTLLTVAVTWQYRMWKQQAVKQNVRAVQTMEQPEKGIGVSGKKMAYLTFDDGPSCLTEKYLDILKENGVKATFFLIGQQVEGNMEMVVRRQIREGHEVGIHTYSHDAGKIYASEEAYWTDVLKTKELLERKFYYQSKLLRFPWGSANAYIRNYKESITKQFQCQGLEYQDWNVSAEDSVGSPTVDSILRNVRKDYKKVTEPVILMHDSSCNRQSLAALQEVIDELKNAGYQFEVLSKRSRPCHFGE